MTEESPESPGIDQAQMVEDLILTDAFLIKGTVEGKFARLSKVLNSYKKRYLVVTSAQMIDLRRGEVIRTPRVHINMQEIVLAHEYVDPGGDFYQKALTKEKDDTDSIRIRAFYHGSTNLEVGGRIRPAAYEDGGLDGAGKFFVIDECVVRGLDLSVSDQLNALTNLGYAIVNKESLSYIYDFS